MELTEDKIVKRRAYGRKSYEKNKLKYAEQRKDYYKKNKEAYAQRSHKWYAETANKISMRERKHGIDFWAMYESQGGLCAIGGEPLPDNLDAIQVDHDHETQVRRGLTCRAHNVGLGMFNDDWELLEKAAKYIFDAKVRYINGVSN